MVSMVIPTYNQARELDQLLSAILKANHLHKLETVILDQGSTDHTSQVLAQHASRLFIRHVKTKSRDPHWLVKLGADKARNKYLLFLPAYTDYPANFFPVALQQMPAPGQGIFFYLEKNALSSSQIRSEQKSIKEILSQFDVSNKTQPATSFAFGTNGASLLCRSDDFRGLKSKDRIKPIEKPLAINAEKTSTKETKKSAKPSKKTDNKDLEYKKAEKTVKNIRYKLFNLGFIERAYQDLEELTTGKSPHKRRLAARELALWHANKYTAEDSQKSLEWLSIAKQEERDPVKIRQNAVLEAESLQALGQTKKAITVIERELKKESHADLFLARANLEPEISTKLTWINKALRLHGLSEITCKPEGKATPYDGLQAKPGAIQQTALPADAPKVTVIIPAYNAQDTISVALDSILCQTWTNLEILVVDDCSTDDTVEVIESYVQKDKRVRLIKAEMNQGPYVARNLALREATGEFVTVNDADDWSHPEKIEIQAVHLVENQHIAANTSKLVRILSSLRFYRRGAYSTYFNQNMSSLMFRRQLILNYVGYWDSVRFGADSEYPKRIKAILGKEAFEILPTGAVSFARQNDTSLTADSCFGYQGYPIGVRKAYVESYSCWHRNGNSLFTGFPIKERTFSVPAPMDIWKAKQVSTSERTHLDVIIATDFRLTGGTIASSIEEIKSHLSLGIQTGIVPLYRYDLKYTSPWNKKILDMVDGDRVHIITYGQNVSCDLLIVRHPPVLNEYQRYIPNIRPKDIRVIVNQPPSRDYNDQYSRLYELNKCQNNLIRYFSKTGAWHPIGPAVRNAIIQEPEFQKTINLASKDWVNIIDAESWQVQKKQLSSNSKPVIGRHSRDQYVKWPANNKDLLAAYPENDLVEVRILGGADTPKTKLGYIPENWTIYPFDSLAPKDFLTMIDVFVYFTHPGLIEAFGRTPLEAMAAGVPVIVPETFRPLFKEGAIYATPFEVQDIVLQLHMDREYYNKRSEIGRRFVFENFGYECHHKRLAPLVEIIRDEKFIPLSNLTKMSIQNEDNLNLSDDYIEIEKKHNVHSCDICIITDLRFTGGNASSTLEEIKAFQAAGKKVLLIHCPSDNTVGKPISTRYQQHLDIIYYYDKIDSINTDILLMRSPLILTKSRFTELIQKITAQKSIFIVNNSLINPTRGVVYSFDFLEKVMKSIDSNMKYIFPLGPNIRNELVEGGHGQSELLAAHDWPPTFNLNEISFNPKQIMKKPYVIGRHGRDDKRKWLEDKNKLLKAYPATKNFKIRILGGANKAKKILGKLPDNWEVYPFGTMDPVKYLSRLDVFVYFPHSKLNEAFGRSIMEAIFAGVPCILPPRFKETFTNMAFFCHPEQVTKVVERLSQDSEKRIEFLNIVRNHALSIYDSKVLINRLERLSENLSKKNNNKKNHGNGFLNLPGAIQEYVAWVEKGHG